MKKMTVFSAIILCCTSLLSGQTSLTFDEALVKTLEHNHGIRMARVDVEMAEHSARPAALGYLPRLDVSGSYNWTHYGGNQTLVNEERNLAASSSHAYQANAAVSYVIFDGRGRKYRYELAVGDREFSALGLRELMESTILDLSASYYEVARLQEQNASLDSTLRVSQLRYKRAKYAEEFGQSTALDILNAQVDLNTDSINLIRSRQLEANARRNLNLMMGAAVEEAYMLHDDLLFSPAVDAEVAVEATLANGSLTQQARQLKANAEWSIKAVRSDWYPELSVSAGYDYRGTEDPNGVFLIGSNQYGPRATLSLNWPVFDGTRKSRLANAHLGVERSQILLEQAERQARTLALNARAAYLTALGVMHSSETSVQTAQDNFDRSMEAFQLGVISSVEFRQAQLNLLSANLQMSEARYEARKAELSLLALMGRLL